MRISKKNNLIYYVYTKSSGGPKANFEIETSNLKVLPVNTKKIDKSNFFKRFFQEKAYSKRMISQIKYIDADYVISANTPLSVQSSLFNWSQKKQIKFIFWLQDIISIAAESILTKKLSFIGLLIAKLMNFNEKKYYLILML